MPTARPTTHTSRQLSAEIPESEWRVLSERLKVHRSDQLGTYRGRRLAEVLAAHPELAEALEEDRRAADEELARLQGPLDDEEPLDG
jgi:hypothetical protein